MTDGDWLSLLRELVVVLLWAVPILAALLAAAALLVFASRGIRQASQRSRANRSERHRFAPGTRWPHGR